MRFGNLIVRALYGGGSCTKCAPKRSGPRGACVRHRVFEWLADELGIVGVEDGGAYREGWLEFRPWKWVGGIPFRMWPRTAELAYRERVADFRRRHSITSLPWDAV